MIITPQSLQILETGFKTVFNQAWNKTQSNWDKVALETSSHTSEEVYPFVGQMQPFREWVGDRVIGSIEEFGFTIKNLKYETTIGVPREKIEDDQFGLFNGALLNMGRVTKLHPDMTIFGLLRDAFTKTCYDGQNFFDTDHPVGPMGNGAYPVVSNMQAGTGPGWFLLDTTQAVKPLIWQKRLGYEFQALTQSGQDHVFLRDEYLYGVRARVAAGLGLWQLAFGSKAPLSPNNYAAARNAMASLRGDQGQILGVTPSLLVVPPALEGDARTLLKATSINASTNVWHESAELLVTPFVA